MGSSLWRGLGLESQMSGVTPFGGVILPSGDAEGQAGALTWYHPSAAGTGCGSYGCIML